MFDDMFSLHGFDDEGDFMPLISIEEEDEMSLGESYPDLMPILVLKNTVLFPGVIIPITVGRQRSIKAINKAYERDRFIAVLSQKDSKLERPNSSDIFKVGTVARIIKLIRMPDGSLTAVLQGRQRFTLRELLTETPYLEGFIEMLNYISANSPLEFDAVISAILDTAKQIIQLTPHIPPEAILMLQNITNMPFFLNFIASNLNTKVEIKQNILAESRLFEKAKMILKEMDEEFQLLSLKDQIESKVKVDIEKQQRDYYLNQQLKTIQEELGQNPQEDEIREMIKLSKKKKWSKEVAQTFTKEISRLRRLNPQAAEYSVVSTYLELLLDLPWQQYTKDNFDLKKVKRVLDQDHFGLEKVKERILEHLAVLKLKGDMKAPILCLVGPPGVGKTSLGKSIARALKRKFVRMSLGGLHDESEIRGHRKTYIGAMPGRILQSLKKVGASNPVFVLDEIDKVGKDFRGDPSSALLEVLDPEQNSTFHDNYLDLEYDLSKILFIATANGLQSIQPALLDRMEIIQVSGYSTEEKIEIAKRHLIPEQRKEHGLKGQHVRFTSKVLEQIIQQYTRESGVRNLKRQIAGVMRHIAKKVAMEEIYHTTVKTTDLKPILGPIRFNRDAYQEHRVPGVAVGLAWTQTGGDILFIEVSLSKGKGKLTLTGNLGDVMKESATTALSFIKAHSDMLRIDSKTFEEYDVHIHVPEGAIPKDGPSAGITMLSALTSAFTKQALKPYLAMTGEITLRGKVLPVGGIKEKILAAKRAGIKDIILCYENEKHVEEINTAYIEGVNFHYVKWMTEVLKVAI